MEMDSSFDDCSERPSSDARNGKSHTLAICLIKSIVIGGRGHDFMQFSESSNPLLATNFNLYIILYYIIEVV